MKYLKKFETQAAYEAAQSGLILPNVSLTVDNNTVHYNPSTPPTPSHDYVEIGGIKWATMNVGATGVTDYGLYFQWGDTQGYTADQVGEGEGQKYFGWSDYKYSEGGGCASNSGEITKYNESDGLTTLQASDDAVTAAWGGSWRMPTKGELQVLGNAVNTAWTADYEDSGVAGLVCTDKTDSSKKLFFPFSEYECGVANYMANYWSSSIGEEISWASSIQFSQDWAYFGLGGEWRANGCLIRGVLDE